MTAVSAWLMVDCRNSPFPVDRVISAVQKANNSPVPCSYGTLRPSVPEGKRAPQQAGGFKLQVWFLNICKTHIYRHWSNVSGRQFWSALWPLASLPVTFPTLPVSLVFGGGRGRLRCSVLGPWANSQLYWIGCVLLCDSLLKLVSHSSGFWDTYKVDGLIQWATWVSQFQIISFTSN